MNKYRYIFLPLFVVLLSFDVIAQDLRIDLNRISAEAKTKKTNGEYLDYLKKEINSIIRSYGRQSKEYIYLQGLYLDDYHAIFKPYATLDPASRQEYSAGRKELLLLTEKVYGKNSWQYGNAVLMHAHNYANMWNETPTDSLVNTLMGQLNDAIDIFWGKTPLTDTEKFSFLSMSYVQKGNLFTKLGLTDSAIISYKTALIIRNNHPVYDNFFPSFLATYANALSEKDQDKGLELLVEYEPLIKEKYASAPQIYFTYLTNILSHYYRNSYIDTKTAVYFSKADSLCALLYGTSSVEYITYSLDYKLPLYKKTGWTALVIQELMHITELFKNDATLLSANENLVFKFGLEWYYYGVSIKESRTAFEWLKWTEKNDVNTHLNRFSFSSKLTLYRELASYYTYRNIDSCIQYNLKVLALEISAKEKWGDYVVHQYHELAELLANLNDTDFIKPAVNYCNMALQEYEAAYGRESAYYKSAQYTKSIIELKQGKGKNALKGMWPHVYARLADRGFIPPLNSSVFQFYGDILNSLNMPDSADFFYHQVYLRNNSAQFFRVLGNTQELQLKSLEDIYIQNDVILTQHFNRYKDQGNKYVSKSLAQELFKKNLIYQVQAYTNEAIRNAGKERLTNLVEDMKRNKLFYDSLLYAASNDVQLVDSAYSAYDFDRSWLIQSYILKQSGDSLKLRDLRREYTYDDVQHALKNDECFIDISRFLRTEKGPTLNFVPCYAFVIVNKTSGSKLEYFFIEDARVEEIARSGNINKLSSILSPIIKQLRNYKRIYIRPDGIFNLVNFYSLKDENDEFLIQSKVLLYVNTLEEAGARPQEQPAFKSAAFFQHSFNPKPEQNAGNSKAGIFSSPHFSNLRQLPYSGLEVEAAAERLNKKGWQTTQYTEDNCNERFLKDNSFPGILHIATHGYYIPDEELTKTSHAISGNPYLRSGLILGQILTNNKDLNENVLTAYEVMDLDLKNTSLVVLSACESAKGELNAGQGVYGIQRAFKIAGARTVLVSVNKVDDKATQLLMQYFYDHVAEGEGYAQALRKAQLQMLSHPLFKKPEYWSGFILIGQ